MHKIEHMCTVPYDTFSFVQQQNGTDLCSSWLYISQDIPTTHPLTRYVTMPCCGQLANFSCFRPRYKHQSNGIKPDMNGIKDNGARPSRINGKLKAHYAALHKHVGGMRQLGESALVAHKSMTNWRPTMLHPTNMLVGWCSWESALVAHKSGNAVVIYDSDDLADLVRPALQQHHWLLMITCASSRN